MSAQKRKPPTITKPSEPRETELIGLTNDGRLVLWSTGMVQPVSRFETSPFDGLIEGGHYVINWQGHAVTVHCGNMLIGKKRFVSVLFMCNRGSSIPMRRAAIEPMLIGKVIPDREAEARRLRLLEELTNRIIMSHDTPERARGRIA